MGVDKQHELWYNTIMIRNNTKAKENKMSYNALYKKNIMNNEKKIAKHLMAKGYSELEAKRLAQQAAKQLEISRIGMMKAIIPDRG